MSAELHSRPLAACRRDAAFKESMRLQHLTVYRARGVTGACRRENIGESRLCRCNSQKRGGEHVTVKAKMFGPDCLTNLFFSPLPTACHNSQGRWNFKHRANQHLSRASFETWPVAVSSPEIGGLRVGLVAVIDIHELKREQVRKAKVTG